MRHVNNWPVFTVFHSLNKKCLRNILYCSKRAKKRDHRKIGKELELFTFSQKVGQGLPLWFHKEPAYVNVWKTSWKKFRWNTVTKPVITPHIGNKELYVTSGHYAKYGKDSFQPIHTPAEGEEFLLKPMNCPHHCEIYRFKPRSYKRPYRFAWQSSVQFTVTEQSWKSSQGLN